MVFITALILFAILTLVLLSTEIMFTYATQGFGYGFSSNRAPVARSPFAVRIQRTYLNQVEAASYAVPILGAAAISGLESSSAELAAHLFILGRLAYSVLYYSGLPFVRVLGFLVANLSLLYIVIAMFAAGLA